MSSTSLVGGYVYVGSDKVHCLNAHTGEEIWQFTAVGTIYYRSSPAISGGFIYIGRGSSGKIYCLDAQTGVKNWEFETGDDVTSSPAIAGGYLYVGSYDHKVYALNIGFGGQGDWPTFQHDYNRTGLNLSTVCDHDNDEDGILDILDNCPADANPNQEDIGDGDGVGDVCDNCPDESNSNQEDSDNDEIGNICDNCPEIVNPTQGDLDNDEVGDICDNCPNDANLGQEDEDSDEVGDICDNCPNNFNPDQEDTYPPQGNGTGNACDCESDFDCSGSVDSLDVEHFLWDFGRSEYNNPCTNERWCYGDFLCDGAVDSADVTKFLEDFGRSEFFNPCPACEVGAWCEY